MVRIHPFAAVQPQPNLAARIACPPYDVVTTAEARQIARAHSESFMRVVRPEVDLPEGASPHQDAAYETARQNFERLQRDGLMVKEREPRVYLYRQVLDHRQQTGVVCCCHATEYEKGTIKRHELTRPDKEDDRMRHALAIGANAGPVFLAFRDDPRIARLIDEGRNERPLFHFNAPDGVTHTVWTVRDAQPFVDAFRRVPAAYIADGHHRAASAVRAARQLREANPAHTGEEEYNWFLTTLFPASELRIFSYNRLVRDLRGRTPAQMLEALERVGRMRGATTRRQPEGRGAFCAYLEQRWHEITFDPASIDASDPIRSLDADLLQSRVLEPLLGIADVRTDQRIEFVGGPRGPELLEERVKRGDGAIAFSLHPTTMEQLMAVADADLVMPPKSTWFEPKLRSGLLVHLLE